MSIRVGLRSMARPAMFAPRPWLTGWGYRKSHEIDGTTEGAQTDYQVKVVVHRTTGTDSGEDVYVGTKCLADFGDIRFTADDGLTLLDHWMESIVGGVATFWVEVASIPDSPGSATIYIYYGKDPETTTSDGDDTFPLFDDFPGDSLDTEKWELWKQAAGSVAVSGGNLVFDSPAGTNTHAGVKSVHDFSGEGTFRIVSRAKAYRYGVQCNYLIFSYGYDPVLRPTGGVNPDDGWNSYHTTHYGTRRMEEYDDGTLVDIVSSSYSYTNDTWKRIYATVLTDRGIYYLAAEVENTGGDYTAETSDNVFLGANGWGGGHRVIGYYDWVFVRKYVSPEPAHGDWGSEESV